MSPHHRPKRSLGQNFLVDGNLQRKIVEALDPAPGDEVLEVGPGKGALTQHLVGRCGRLFLVELDRDLAAALEAEHGGVPGLSVLNRDILEVDLEELTEGVAELKVVGNIPYNITTPILFHLLATPRPREILLMVQKEVAERIMAPPGSSAYGALSVGVRSVADVEKVLEVPASAFRPVPAVDSMVIRVRPVRPEPLSRAEEGALRELTRMVFGQRRKQIQSILRNHPRTRLSREEVQALEGVTGLDLTRRPGTLSTDELLALSRRLLPSRKGKR